MSGEDSIESLEQQIAEKKKKKETLDAALKVDKNNKELQKLRDDAVQLIGMTKEVLQLKRLESLQQQEETQETSATDDQSDPVIQKQTMRYPVGHVCRAKWSQDGNWYDAVIEAIDQKASTYTVLFTGYGNRDNVKEEHISPIASSLKAEQDLTPIAIPESLRISKEDTETVKAAKKKKIHSIKSKNRFKKMDAMTNSKKNEWKSFMQQATKKRRGLPIGRKESMFRSPDSVDGKVGVVGSGKGMTSFNDTRKVDTRRNKVALSLEQPKK